MNLNEEVETIRENFDQIVNELAKIIVGQKTLIKNLFICLLCGGHALIEGVPGLGKTLIVRSLSKILDLEYSRIQFTPDLMPADILGTNIVKEDGNGNRFFEFYKGPIFGQLILADEINRASPKTQSALLEAMQEGMVTVFGSQYKLEPPFMVLATQNPIEMEGTYPLPEAQIDRFFFKLKIHYPNHDELQKILEKTTEDYRYNLNRVVGAERIIKMKSLIKKVPVASHIKDFTTRMVLATHPASEHATDKIKEYILYGASPRGVQSLILAGKVSALINGRFNVALDDIKAIAKPALRHRLALNIRGETEGMDTDELIDEILSKLEGR